MAGIEEVDFCFVTERCSDCPMWGLREQGAQAVKAAEVALETCDNNPRKLVKLRLQGLEDLIAKSSPEINPVLLEPAKKIAWLAATGSCGPNGEKLIRRYEQL